MLDLLNSAKVSSMVANANAAANSNLNGAAASASERVESASDTREVKQNAAMRAIYYSMGDDESANSLFGGVSDKSGADLGNMFKNMDKDSRMQLKSKISGALESRNRQILSDAQAAMINGGKASTSFSDFSGFFMKLQSDFNASSGSNLNITESELAGAFESLNEKYNQNVFDKMI